MLKALKSLGLSKADSEVYLCLAKNPKKARNIMNTLRMSKQQIYRSLKSLEAKGIVSDTRERPAQFSAVSLEEILDLVMKAATEQAKALQASRKELLSTWRSMIEKDSAKS